MATQGGLSDDLLANLAEDIETSEQVEALGRALGFSTAAINRYTETNRLEGRVTCKGTRYMLFDWRQKVEPNYPHLRLKEALINAELVMLADTYLKDTPSVQDIYSKKISESLSVKQCREKLKSRYLNSLCKIKMAPWDPNKYAEFKDMHTVVTMVKKDAYGRDTGKKEILQGSVDEIFSTEVNGTLPVRILISAPAGRGKTTAVAKMAYDWANRVQGSSLENLPLLFVVKLRNTGKQTSIAEAIRSQLLSDVTDLTQDGLRRFIKENQGICHIILDGLDEYAGIAANQGLGSDIVDVMLWEEFPDCRVLVTTRPHLENFFNQGDLPMVYTNMWIEGFSQKSSREYIDKFFASTSNHSYGQDLKDYLDGQPLINELVITPLFCLMVCHLWSEGLLGCHTKTQTDLLDNVNVFLMHHANARSKSYKITHNELSKIICKLGRVALAGLLDDAKKLVFTSDDFRRDLVILERANELGILSKTTSQLTGLPQSHETSSTNVEFYHKLAQEHSAGKYLADQTNKYFLRWKISKLDRVLQKIRVNIGDYENLLRFTAGTKNRLCIRIMEVILDNRFLDESERYRILLDCSSETKDTEQGVSSLVQRCVAAQCILLKSPTVYTAVGMQNLPRQLKQQVRQVRLEGSAISFDVTNGLWSCLGSFATLNTITISDSSLSFSQSPPELTSVTKLKAERVTSHSYEGLISSMPSLKEIDVTIDDDVEGNTSHATASRPVSQSRDQHFPVNIKLQALPSHSRDQKSESREMVAELCLLIREHTEIHQWLQVSGTKAQHEEALLNLFVMSTQLKSLNVNTSGYDSHNYDRQAVKEFSFDMKYCQLSAVMIETLWSRLSYIVSLHQVSVSDSSLRFPPSPPELPSVTKLIANGVTSQSYECLVSSMPSLKEIDVTIDVEGNTSQITASSQSGNHHHPVHITLQTLPSRSRDEKIKSRKTTAEISLLIRGPTGDRQCLQVTGMKGADEESLADLFVKSTHVKSVNLKSKYGSRNHDRQVVQESRLEMKSCHLSAVMTETLWSCFSSMASPHKLSISDSSLSFPPSPPELPSVTKLKVMRVTSQSYEGLLSSIPNVKEVDITVGNAENEDISLIQTSICRHLTGQELTFIRLDEPYSLPSEESVSGMSREMMRGLGLLINDEPDYMYHEQQEATLLGVVCGPGETVDLVQGSTRVMSSILYSKQFSESMDPNRKALNIGLLTMRDCMLTAVVTSSIWSYLRSFPSLRSLSISDSSLSFPPSPPELTSITKLDAKRVTSQSYEGVLSSLPDVEEIEVTFDDAERDISQITAGLFRTGGQQLARITLEASTSLQPKKKEVSRETMRRLGILIKDQANNLQTLAVSGVNSGDEEDLVPFIECCRHAKSLDLLLLLCCGSKSGGRLESYAKDLLISNERLMVMILHEMSRFDIKDYCLSTEMTIKLWSSLRFFTSISHLFISDSSLTFPPFPPVLTSVTRLEAKRVTSQSYEGVLSSLPDVEEIEVTFDDAERDISQITADLRWTGGQQLTVIRLHAADSLPQQKKTISTKTMGGLGPLIREQTKNLQRLILDEVKCTNENDLVYLIECCRHVKAMKYVRLSLCGTKGGGRLSSHLERLHSKGYPLRVEVWHDTGGGYFGEIPHIH